jgi:hypothetical protein
MAFDLETYKRISGRLDDDDIDYDAFRDRPLAPALLGCVRYMHDVEFHTSCYLRNLLNTRAHHDPEITTFLTMWSFEEYWHGEALAKVLAAHDEPAGEQRVATMRQRLGWRINSSPVLWFAFSSAARHFLAVHMTFGVINEWTTQAGYARLNALADHPVLSELLRRIMRQEGRHIDYYLTRSRIELEKGKGAQRTTRFALRTMWKPVGAGVMPEADTHQLISTLFGAPEGRIAADRIDRRVDTLPGLRGLDLMHNSLRRYAGCAEQS